MPKCSLDDLPKFDAQALIAKTRLGALRHGETHALSVHVSGLERALQHKMESVAAKAQQQDISLCLNADMSALVMRLPGEREHTVSFPLDWRADLILEYIVKVLRERRGQTNYIATAGAPTQADLDALAKATRKAPRKVGVVENLSLEDLGL